MNHSAENVTLADGTLFFMHYPGYETGNITLLEGEWFPFRIHNLVQLQDDDWYYVLQDVNGLKHFMPAEYYKNWEFSIGNEIICKIDRINCTGRIFLEPKHPVYDEGEIYYFEVINYSHSGEQNILLVRENSGNSIEIPINGISNVDINETNMVRCVVKSIKKGKLILDILPNYF